MTQQSQTTARLLPPSDSFHSPALCRGGEGAESPGSRGRRAWLLPAGAWGVHCCCGTCRGGQQRREASSQCWGVMPVQCCSGCTAEVVGEWHCSVQPALRPGQHFHAVSVMKLSPCTWNPCTVWGEVSMVWVLPQAEPAVKEEPGTAVLPAPVAHCLL